MNQLAIPTNNEVPGLSSRSSRMMRSRREMDKELTESQQEFLFAEKFQQFKFRNNNLQDKNTRLNINNQHYAD